MSLLRFPTINRKIIQCPSCARAQTFEQDRQSKIYFPIPPYCCDAMMLSDDEQWNKRLDERLESAAV